MSRASANAASMACVTPGRRRPPGRARSPSHRSRRRSSATRGRPGPGPCRRRGRARCTTPRSRRAATRARRRRSARPPARSPSRSSADDLVDPLDLGDDVAGAPPQHVVGQPGQHLVERLADDLAQRLDTEDLGRLLAGCAARAVLPVGQGVAGPGVGDEQDDVVGGRGRTAPARGCRRGSRAAGRAARVQCIAAAWSMPPVGAPAMSFSARWHAAARTSRPSGESSRPRPKRSDTAAATAHSSAAELDSPAPRGTRPSTTTSRPRTAYPACRRAHTTPATYAVHPCGCPAATSSMSTSTDESSCSEWMRSRSSSRGEAAHRVRCGSAMGSARPPL